MSQKPEKPQVGQFFIEKEYNYGSQWIVQITKLDVNIYTYKVISLVDSLDTTVIGLFFTHEKDAWFNEFRYLTDDEKVELL